MTPYELVELLEKAMDRHPGIQAAVRTSDDQLAVQDQHGVRHWITVEET